MGDEKAAPCRHRGAPPDEVINRVVDVINKVASDEDYLYPRGLTSSEFLHALPVAIERMRGRQSASNKERRDFLVQIFNHLASIGSISEYVRPSYGSDTVYRLAVPNVGDIAVIQKGCPDGKHSTVAWRVPEWAVETYIWWICPSLKNEPGWHISAGVNRLRREFFSDRPDMIDGVIFQNQTCGSDLRPCPKMDHAVSIGDALVPPPCIWVFPERNTGPDFNWSAGRSLFFPRVLLSGFGIQDSEVAMYTGHVGFKTGGRETRTNISSRFGPGRSTTLRS